MTYRRSAPARRARARNHGLLSVLFAALATGACTATVEDVGAASSALHDPPAEGTVSLADAGISHIPDGAVDAVIVQPIALECVAELDAFLCDGACGPGEGCCVTGMRPRGVCRPYDACSEQCANDCGVAQREDGERRGLHCAALCTWVAPTARCTAAH